MKKNYILDTNVIIHNPYAICKFEDNDIYITHTVIEELDGLKDAPGEVGYNAREFLRTLGYLRTKGDLTKGVETGHGGKIYLSVCDNLDYMSLPDGWNDEKQDNLILLSALMLRDNNPNPDEEFILVTNDTNVLIKGDLLGIKSEVYKNDRVGVNHSLYKGRREIKIPDELFNKLMDDKQLVVSEIQNSEYSENVQDFVENEFVLVQTWTNGSTLCQYRHGILYQLRYADEKPYDLVPRNAGQSFLIEALMTSYEERPLTIVNGPAGTGKTLLAMGCGLEQVMEMGRYKRILLCRPNVTMDEDLGFLPGTEQEKINPLLRGAWDNLEILLGGADDEDEYYNKVNDNRKYVGYKRPTKSIEDKIQELLDRGYVRAEAIAYLRGRSITDTFIIIDEAQNTTPNQMLSIITRAGEGSKIVIMGDVNQIDSPRLDKHNNGLAYCIEKMHIKPSDIVDPNEALTDIITFTENECTRSKLAKLASDRLKK